ncbi:MAG: bifunctional folylpolyglutamate synthase/dihydrofolate synthase [Wenzhouxiangella sp.]
MVDQLSDWLRRLERRSPEARIELGLERVQRVLQALAPQLDGIPIITVGGTNGKGSTVAMLEAIGRAAGLRTLAYSSPHLFDFAERIRIDGRPAASAWIVEALDQVEAARGPDSLTYFEHITLAALWLAGRERPDLLLLEVGLGGRLDAVNVVDADVAVITSIGLDHTDWLGPTRLSIGREKAGIARPGRALIVGERRLPRGLQPVLEAIGADLSLAGRDFRWRRLAGGRLQIERGSRVWRLPRPALQGPFQLANAACAVLAISALQTRVPVSEAQLAAGLVGVRLAGRLQLIAQRPELWLDVAHNGAGARALAQALGPASPGQRSTAVFSALADKDVGAIGRALKPCFDRWLVAGLDGDRGACAGELAGRLAEIPVAGPIETVESVSDGLQRALASSAEDDRIVVFGSFRTVAEAARGFDIVPGDEPAEPERDSKVSDG